MKFLIELDADRCQEIFEQFIKEREEDDTINSLSIIFDRSEEEVYEPALFFCPDWDIDFEARIPLVEALQEYLDEESHDDDDHRDLVTRLLATTNEWIKEQRAKSGTQYLPT
jgi:hypothetical protein